jgi:hypothetical protein
MKCTLLVELVLKYYFCDHLASLWSGSFQKACEKKAKVMDKGSEDFESIFEK